MPKRKIGNRKFNKRIFILCQGKVTEPLYFRHFSVSNNIKGLHLAVQYNHITNALHFVNDALKTYQDEIKQYDEFWVIFDKDETSNDDFNRAIANAEKNGLKCAYSNQAFELWFIHHFKILSSPMNRTQYSAELSNLLELNYSKDSKTTKKIIEKIFPLFDNAISNSEKSYNDFEHNSPAIEESSTTVFKLAKEIRKFFI